MADTSKSMGTAGGSGSSDRGSQGSTQGGQGLQGSLTVFDMVVYGLIFMVPIATFSLFGSVSNASNGMPALAYFVAFVAMFFSVLSFGVMIRTFPSSGSIYTYTTKSLGAALGFIAGWLMLLQYLLSPDMVFTMAGEALTQYFPAVPVWAWCLIILVFVFFVASRGMSTTMMVNRIALVLELVVLAMFVVLGIIYVVGHPETSYFSFNAIFNPSQFSGSGLMSAASVAVFSFVGFGCVATLTQEAKDERRGPGRAMMVMVIILMVIFVATCFIATSVDPTGAICQKNETNGFYQIAELVGGKWFGELCALSVALAQGVFTGLVGMVSVSRILCVMGKSGSLPAQLATIDEKTGVPIVATRFVGILSAVMLPFLLMIGMDGLATVVNFGALSTYCLLNICVIAWYWVRQKDRSNPIRYLVCPALGFVITLAVFVSLGMVSHVIGVAWIVIGIVYYLVMTKRFHRSIDMGDDL